MLWLLLLLLLTVLVGPNPLPGQSGDPGARHRAGSSLAESVPAFTETEAAAWQTRIQPLVEEVTGRKLRRPPSLRLVDRSRIEEVLVMDILPQFRAQSPGVPAESIEKSARQAARGSAGLLLGKFGFSDQVMYLLPGNFRPLLRTAGIPVGQASAIGMLILAHELTHAIQDQEIGLKKTLARLTTPDAAMAFNAVMEGHAVLVMEEVGRRLGLDDTVIHASRLFAAGAVHQEDPAMEMINKVIATQFEAIYLGGRAFMAYHQNVAGRPRLWYILAHPPRRTSQILDPGSYQPEGDTRLELGRALEGLEPLLGLSNPQAQRQEVGHISLRGAYAGMRAEDLAFVLDSISQVQSLIARDQETGSMCNVSLIMLKDDSRAADVISRLETLARDNIVKLRASPTVKVVRQAFSDFPWEPGGLARHFRLEMDVTGRRFNQNVYRFVRGPAVVEVITNNHQLTTAGVQAIARTVLARIAGLQATGSPGRQGP